MRFIYRLHAIERMFERDISESDVEDAINNGEVIQSYTDDKPYPSFLSLKYINEKALHVVYALDENKTFIVITVYRPDNKIWTNNFKTKRDKV